MDMRELNRTEGVLRIPRPALLYYGAKWLLAPWIIRNFPPHTTYVEPYSGSAACLIRKPPSQIEVYNDADSRVVNFFQVLRDRPDDLIPALLLTPHSREELLRAVQTMGMEPGWQAEVDELEAARMFYVLAWQSRGGPTGTWESGWRYDISDSRNVAFVSNWNDVSHLPQIAQRLKDVQIEHDDALEVIRRFDTPDTLFYVDPPYPQHVRYRWAKAGYRYEMEDDDHIALAALLKQVQGSVIISSYPSAMYDELYYGWESHKTIARTRGGMGRGTVAEATEMIWMNAQARRRQLPLMPRSYRMQ